MAAGGACYKREMTQNAAWALRTIPSCVIPGL